MKKPKSIVVSIIGIFFIVCFFALQILGVANIFSSVASAGLETLLVITLIIFIIVAYNANEKKNRNQALTISVISKQKEDSEKEIHRIEVQIDSIEQRLEEIAEENKSLFDSFLDCELDIERLKKEQSTIENTDEIKRISKLKKSISDNIERNNCEKERLETELRKLSAELSGYKSALRSIKEIAKTIEGYNND